MADATTSLSMSPKLEKVADRAKRNPTERTLALARLIDEAALERAFHRLKKDAAAGIDGITAEQYGLELADNLRALHRRMKATQYRHRPIRRVHIPKSGGKTRPIGISIVEDKIVQGALREVLEALYEQDFLDCSHGFRPGRSAHDAIRALKRNDAIAMYVLEADIVSFFDSIDRKMLMEMLRGRIADESFMRLIGKCLHVGILDGEEYSEPNVGTTQGSVLSPLLGNIYLHHVLDRWFEKDVKPRLRGRSALVRYADDFVILFEQKADAERVMEVLRKRMLRYGLTLHPEKTRLLPFQPPKKASDGKADATFDFLGFTVFRKRTVRGHFRMAFKTRRESLRRFLTGVGEWCHRHRHHPLKDQHAMLSRKLRGHYGYFGINGNSRCIAQVLHWTKRAWKKWLNRRSQRAQMTWERFNDVLRRHALPAPRIVVQIWG